MLEPVFWPLGVNVGCGTDGPPRFHADAKPVSPRLPPPKLTASELAPPPTWVALLKVPEPPVTRPVVTKPFAVRFTTPEPAVIVAGVIVPEVVMLIGLPPAASAPVKIFPFVAVTGLIPVAVSVMEP